MFKINCKICGGNFESKYVVSKYCSDICHIKMRKLTRQTFIPKFINCSFCGKKKIIRANNVRFCSTSCQQKGAYLSSNGERKKKVRNNYYKRKFGLSYQKVEDMKKERQNKCDICCLNKPLVLDHSHQTGKIRGLLCQSCNKGLGHFFDCKLFLKRAEDYLDANF